MLKLVGTLDKLFVWTKQINIIATAFYRCQYNQHYVPNGGYIYEGNRLTQRLN